MRRLYDITTMIERSLGMHYALLRCMIESRAYPQGVHAIVMRESIIDVPHGKTQLTLGNHCIGGRKYMCAVS